MKYVLDGQRFVALTDNNTEAGEMTWSNAGESLIIIDHTFVDNAFRGQGIANELVAQGVAYARENNLIVIQNTKIFYIKNITNEWSFTWLFVFVLSECFYTSCYDYDRINLNVGFKIQSQDGEFLSY